MQSVDVAIVGGGMVGLAVACGLQGSGLRVAVWSSAYRNLWRRMPPQLRVSAINAASEKLLTRLGVWQDILSRRASCYHGMEVWDKDSFGHVWFDDQSMGYSHLGHIVENSVIHYALWNKAQQSSDITLFGPRRITAGGEKRNLPDAERWQYVNGASGDCARTALILVAQQSRYSADFLGLSASRAGSDHTHGRTA